MSDTDVTALANEILAALEPAGEIENWIAARLEAPVDQEVLNQSFATVTRQLLASDPPRAAEWEHLLFATAAASTASHGRPACEACRAAIGELVRMVESGEVSPEQPEPIDTLASGLTLVLTAQQKLRQPIEFAVGRLCDQFPDRIAAMAQRCQNIWQRKGQMTGREGLFLWDLRREEWRLNQDFKPHRPLDGAGGRN